MNRSVHVKSGLKRWARQQYEPQAGGTTSLRGGCVAIGSSPQRLRQCRGLRKEVPGRGHAAEQLPRRTAEPQGACSRCWRQRRLAALVQAHRWTKQPRLRVAGPPLRPPPEYRGLGGRDEPRRRRRNALRTPRYSLRHSADRPPVRLGHLRDRPKKSLSAPWQSEAGLGRGSVLSPRPRGQLHSADRHRWSVGSSSPSEAASGAFFVLGTTLR